MLTPGGDDSVLFAGRFVLEKEAGRGGMGVVHRAFDRATGTTVALKVLHKTEASTVRRFALEAEALGKLNHPNIVRYLAHGVSEDETPYLALEWVDGESLQKRLARAEADDELIALEDVLELGQRLAGALGAAHAAGIVHRDVKPSNVLLVGGNLRQPKLVDFGIVRAVSGSGEHLTTAGTVLGTVGYMAPEQARGEERLDGRADLFSLGCLLFRCLTNRNAFDGSDPMTVLSRLLLHKPPRLQELRPSVPHGLDVLVARLIAKERDQRPASAAEVREALTRIDEGLLDETLDAHRLPEPDADRSRGSRPTPEPTPSPTRARRPLWIGAIAMAVVILGIGIGLRPWRHAADVPAPAAPAPAGTIVTALPISPSCKPSAVEPYKQGMQALRDGRWEGAARAFRRAVEADDACPETHLRTFLVSYLFTPRHVLRERLRAALSFRDALSPRDRFLLDAYAFLIADETPRREEAVRVLQEAVQQYPMDAELLMDLGQQRINLAVTRDELAGALAPLQKATKIDPAYSDAWQMQALVFEHLGRNEEAAAAIDQCLRASPSSIDCMSVRFFALLRSGRCEEATAVARQKASWQPEESAHYAKLATSLAAAHASREAIEEVLLLRWNRLPPQHCDEAKLIETAQLEAWTGHFDVARRTAERLERSLENTVAREPHWAAAALLSDVLFETGESERAARIAEQAILRKDAWTQDQAAMRESADLEPRLLGAALRGGHLTLPQWRKATDAWERANEGALNASERWALKWGPVMDAPVDDAEALRESPDSGELQGAPREFSVNWNIGILDAYAGRVFMHAGDASRAIPLLNAGTRACQGTAYPFFRPRAHLWLGMAKEKSGDTVAACDAYRAVIEQWGKATPRSVTAQEAEKRRRALACK